MISPTKMLWWTVSKLYLKTANDCFFCLTYLSLELSGMTENQHPASFCGFMVHAMLLSMWSPQWTGWCGCDNRKNTMMDVISVCPISCYINIKFICWTRKLLGFRFYQTLDILIFWGCSLLSWSLPHLFYSRSWQGLSQCLQYIRNLVCILWM